MRPSLQLMPGYYVPPEWTFCNGRSLHFHNRGWRTRTFSHLVTSSVFTRQNLKPKSSVGGGRGGAGSAGKTNTHDRWPSVVGRSRAVRTASGADGALSARESGHFITPAACTRRERRAVIDSLAGAWEGANWRRRTDPSRGRYRAGSGRGRYSGRLIPPGVSVAERVLMVGAAPLSSICGSSVRGPSSPADLCAAAPLTALMHAG